MAGFINKHPAVSLFLLATILGGAPLALITAGILPNEYSQLGALSASVAAFILAGIEGGRGHVRELLSRGLVWRVGIKWWLTALLYTAPIALAALYFSSVFGYADFKLESLPPIYQALPMMLLLIVLAGLGEEFGWRGFLLPRLQRHHTALRASLIIGLFHSLWHIPLFLTEGTVQNDWAQQLGFFPAFLGYSAFVVAWAIQLTWFFNNTGGSVLMVAVVHGAGNVWIGGYFNVSENAGIAGNNILTVLMIIISLLIVAVAGRTNLSRTAGRNTLLTS